MIAILCPDLLKTGQTNTDQDLHMLSITHIIMAALGSMLDAIGIYA